MMMMKMAILMILQDADFTGKPSVLLVGQYSTGKTTLIRFLIMVMMIMIMMVMVSTPLAKLNLIRYCRNPGDDDYGDDDVDGDGCDDDDAHSSPPHQVFTG